MRTFFLSLYLSVNFFVAIGFTVFLFIMGYLFPPLFVVAQIVLVFTGIVLITDAMLLYKIPTGIQASRTTPQKLSNGDDNTIKLHINSQYPFDIQLEIIDEVPFQFQQRNLLFEQSLKANDHIVIDYTLHPTTRGVYSFGALNVFVYTHIAFVQRKYRFDEGTIVPVYPSYIQMRKYELLAVGNRLHMLGLKKIRRIGHSMEFEQIRDYVVGDDYRIINWKASARRGDLMVNQFIDEKSQPIYSVIDMGRVMKMPFEGMSLLDYAINTSLALSNVVIKKGDKAGLITFSHVLGNFLLADKRAKQMQKIQELLYKQTTNFLESDYEKLFVGIQRQVKQRSLLLLFTNFESLDALKRQLPYLRRLGRRHLLLVVFFENTTLKTLLNKESENVQDIYEKVIAEKFAFEKRLIIKELYKHGIQAILSRPEDLTLNTLNKYLELKARGLI